MYMSSMSTPVNQLPNKQSATSIPDDPEVLNVLQEMEQEVKTAARVNSAPIPAPPPQQPVVMAPPPPMQPAMIKTRTGGNKWINPDMLQHAAVVGIIAVLVFHPKTMETVYASFPKLGFLEPFDLFVRALLLAALVYVAAVQFGV